MRPEAEIEWPYSVLEMILHYMTYVCIPSSLRAIGGLEGVGMELQLQMCRPSESDEAGHLESADVDVSLCRTRKDPLILGKGVPLFSYLPVM
jgi:hypothetical protein